MALGIGDLVVHPAFGIGHIVDIEEKQFFEEEARLYYKVSRLKHTMWFLLKAEEEPTVLRLVTARNDLDQYRQVLKSPPAPLAADHEQRQRDLFGRLNQGSFQGVCEVLRDLAIGSQREPLGQMETTLLRKTRESLYQEWALAGGVSILEAKGEVESLLVRDTVEPAFDHLTGPVGEQAAPDQQLIRSQG